MSGLTAFVFPKYINNPDVGIHWGRARGPFVEAAADGLSMWICAVAGAMAFKLWRSRWRWFAAATVALCAIGMVLTLTRQVWVGAVAGIVVTFAVSPSLRRYLLPTLAGLALLVGVALGTIPSLRTKIEERSTDNRPVWDRYNSNRAALNMAAERPLLGFGWYRFGAVGTNYYQQSSDYPLTTVGRVHNVLLGNLAELGLIGTVLWVGTLLATIVMALRVPRGPPELEAWRTGLIAVAVCWATVANFTPLGYAFDNYMIWLWPGVLLAAAQSASRPAPVAWRAAAAR
jgi:putative inorganic carbon (hco3(-)) transporter